MNDKFQYAPGKPGFGSKGDRGEDGQQGISMYFTDINPITNSGLINSRIQSNLTLWTSGYNDLPGGRVYVTGDLFIDNEGKAYEINAETDTFEYKLASLNMGGFFLPLGISSDSGFQRYFNSNSSPKYIIDNVYTMSGAINYTAVPENIYNIQPQDFTRIEYTNIKPDLVHNAFTVYSSADPGGVLSDENNKALALVYNESTKTFRLGNIDDVGNIRNTNLTFDVSLLRQTKEAGNSFNQNTPDGAILTNHEINANSLFDSNFDQNPDSFLGVFGTTFADIKWDLYDFSGGDTDVYGDLYFYEYIPSYNGQSFRLDASIVRPLIFTNITSPDGSVRITGLKSDGAYNYHMKVYKNGWSRNSVVKSLFKGAISVRPINLLNESKTAHQIGNPYYFDVSANGPWDVSFGSASWITNVTTNIVGGGDFDGSIGFYLTENTGSTRSGGMTVTVLGGASQIIPISQLGAFTPVTFSLTGGPVLDVSNGLIETRLRKGYTLSQSGLPSDTSVNIRLYYSMSGFNNNGYRSITIINGIRLYAIGKSVSYPWIVTYFDPLETNPTTSGSILLTGLRASDFNSFGAGVDTSLWAYASAGDTEYNFGTNINITDMVVTYMGGSPITISYGNKTGTLYGSYNSE